MATIKAWTVETAVTGRPHWAPDTTPQVTVWEGTETVWARTAESAAEVALRLTARRPECAHGTDAFVRPGGAKPAEAPAPIEVDTWTPVEGKPSVSRRTGWRAVGDIACDLDMRIGASDLAWESRGLDILVRHDCPSKTIPELLGGEPWRVMVAPVEGSNEGHYVHVLAVGRAVCAGSRWASSAVGRAVGPTRPCVGLYTVKVLAGEAEADAVAAALRAWIA